MFEYHYHYHYHYQLPTLWGSKSRFKVLGPRSWVLGWVGGPPKGLQSAAVTLVTSSWRVEFDHIKVKLRKYKAK